MYVFIAACAVFGIVLSQFFKFYVLIPAGVFVTVVALSGQIHEGHSLSGALLGIFVASASLQIGYLAGTISPSFSSILQRFVGMVTRGASATSHWPGHRRARQSFWARRGGISSEVATTKPVKKAGGMSS